MNGNLHPMHVNIPWGICTWVKLKGCIKTNWQSSDA